MFKLKKLFKSGKRKKTPKQLFTVLCESLWPLYVLMRIIGVLPLRFERKNGEIVLNAHKKDWFYYAAYMTFYALLSSYTMWSVATDNENYNIIPQIIVVIIAFIILLQMFLTITFGFALRKFIIEFLFYISEVDKSLQVLDVKMNYKEILKQNYVLIATMTLSAFLRSGVMLSTVTIDMIQSSTLFMAAFIKSLTKYSFILLVLLISERFKKINNIIKELYKNKPIKQLTDVTENELLNKLYITCRLHYKLCNVARILNRAEAFQLLFSLGVTLSDILFQAYYLYVAFTIKFDVVSITMILCPILWIIDEIMEVTLLVRACASTCDNVSHKNKKNTMFLFSFVLFFFFRRTALAFYYTNCETTSTVQNQNRTYEFGDEHLCF